MSEILKLEQRKKQLTKQTFESIMKKAEDIQNRSIDFLDVPASSMSYQNNGKLGTLCRENSFYELSSNALSQLTDKLNIPQRYVVHCFKNNRSDLIEANINAWLSTYSEPLLLRTYTAADDKDYARAVLSKSYAVFDAVRILEVVAKYIDFKEYSLKSSYIDEENLHLRFVKKTPLKVSGEDLYPAIFIDSSDVGRKSISICFAVYKQVCTNGLVIKQLNCEILKQKHFCIDQLIFESNVIRSLRNISILEEQVTDLINTAIGFDFSISSDRTIEQEVLKNVFGFSQRPAEQVLRLMEEKYSISLWGFVNAVTEHAQTYTLKKRIEIEEKAGDFLYSVVKNH